MGMDDLYSFLREAIETEYDIVREIRSSGGELQFDGCVFSGNGEDIVNKSGYTVSP